MAEDSVVNSLDQLEKEITCSICWKHYTHPKVLPCLHYYCKECIFKISIRVASNQPFSCPECRQEINLPSGGVEGLKTAFFIDRIKSNVCALRKLHNQEEVKCEECTGIESKAEAFCRQCIKFICKDCVQAHKKMRLFSSHVVNSVQDLKLGVATELVPKEEQVKKCDVHEEPLVIYCFDCENLICRDCTVKIHKNHKFEFSKVAAPTTKRMLGDHLVPLQELSLALSSGICDIQTTKREIETERSSVALAIHHSFDELQLILDRHKQKLLDENSALAQEKTKKLTPQETGLCEANTSVLSVVGCIQQFIEHCTDNDLMNTHTSIKKKIEEEMEGHCTSGNTTKQIAEQADIGVEVKICEDLQLLCQTKAKITCLSIDPALCTLTGGVDNADICRTYEVVLTTKLANLMPARQSAVVVGQLKSVHNGSVIECVIKPMKSGKYCLRYTPTSRGRHELSVTVNDWDISGSPFPVFVNCSPSGFDQPVRVWNEIKQPSGIGINSSNEVFVSEYYGDIVKIDHKGNKEVIVEHSKTGLTILRAISTTANDIYCVDRDTNRVMRCDKNGDNIQITEVQQEHGPGYWGVTVVGEEVMVCERNNKGSILVYNKLLDYLRRIQHIGLGEIMAVSADCHGNLYAADYDNSCIGVFAASGMHLRSFGSREAGTLADPNSLCVSGQHVYVTSWTKHEVAMFTIAGSHVTTIGGYGNKEGDFSAPLSVNVDRDGFLFVADFDNNRIQCF